VPQIEIEFALENMVAALCFFCPTPLAAIPAAWLALRCVKPWRAFLTGLSITMLLATALGAAMDQAPVWGSGWSVLRVWFFHLCLSPLVAVPLGAFCAARVQQRARLQQ